MISIAMNRPFFTALCLAALFAAAGCASYNRDAGTGDLAIRLAWDGVSDLDLLVEDPTGACIFFVRRESESRGLLDVDCNAGVDRMCAEPVENVFWPHDGAPRGRYRFWVHAHGLVPAEAPLELELQVLHDVKAVWTRRLKIRDHDELIGPFVYEYPGTTVAGPATGNDVPDCVSVIERRRRRPGS